MRADVLLGRPAVRNPARQGEVTSVSRASRTPQNGDLIPDGELEALYGPGYLADCADPEARQERLAELKRRIKAGAYRIDAERIAEELLERGDMH